MAIILALLIFPGLLFTVALALILRVVVAGNMRFEPIRLPGLSFESIAGSLSIALAALGMALLPWPLQLAPSPITTMPLVAWLAIEGAFLLPLLPGLLALDPLVNRATIREAQIGLAGRVVIWMAIGAPLWQARGITNPIGLLLLGVAGLLALPVAIGTGPFAADRTLSVSGAEHGLDQATAGLLALSGHARGAVLLAALALALIPRDQLLPGLALLVRAALVTVIMLVLRRLNGRLPRMALPSVLRWCWWRALPLVVAGLIYLAFVP